MIDEAMAEIRQAIARVEQQMCRMETRLTDHENRLRRVEKAVYVACGLGMAGAATGARALLTG